MFKQSQITSFSLVVEYNQDAPLMIYMYDHLLWWKEVKEEIEMGRSERQKEKSYIEMYAISLGQYKEWLWS